MIGPEDAGLDTCKYRLHYTEQMINFSFVSSVYYYTTFTIFSYYYSKNVIITTGVSCLVIVHLKFVFTHFVKYL